MRSYRVACVVLFTVFTLACSTASVSKRGRQIEVVGRDEVASCIQVDQIEGVGRENYIDLALDHTLANRAVSDAINEAAGTNATHIVFGSMSHYGKYLRVNAISYQCSQPVWAKTTSSSLIEETRGLKIVGPEEITKCQKLGVFRGIGNGHDEREAFEKEAMKGLINEAVGAKATHLVKGHTYTVHNSPYKIAFMIQFGIAFSCPNEI